MEKTLKRIALTGAAGQIAYSLVFQLAQGDIFGNQQPIALHLCDLPEMARVLEGVAMELEDCAFPLLKEIRVGHSSEEMFHDIDLALLIGAKPRGPGMERRDLLVDNGKIFVEQGRALNDSAKRDVRVFVVGNPCNTNCLIALHHAPKLNRKNFHAMMRLDQNRAQNLLAKKAKVDVSAVTQVTVWGNHSATQVPDFTHAKIKGERATEVIKDSKWFQGEFIETIQKRGAAIIAARGKSSAASAAHCLIESVKSLYRPTPAGDWFSSAVFSADNPYGIDENLIFGFPCRSQGNGEYEIVADLDWDFFIKEKIAVTQQELIAEREYVLRKNE